MSSNPKTKRDDAITKEFNDPVSLWRKRRWVVAVGVY